VTSTLPSFRAAEHVARWIEQERDYWSDHAPVQQIDREFAAELDRLREWLIDTYNEQAESEEIA
jgi:hypothetical protein